MTKLIAYPVGIPGQPWGEEERSQWQARQSRKRRYDRDVTSRIEKLADRFERVVYGQLDYDGETYTLYALRSHDWTSSLPAALAIIGAVESVTHIAPPDAAGEIIGCRRSPRA